MSPEYCEPELAKSIERLIMSDYEASIMKKCMKPLLYVDDT